LRMKLYRLKKLKKRSNVSIPLVGSVGWEYKNRQILKEEFRFTWVSIPLVGSVGWESATQSSAEAAQEAQVSIPLVGSVGWEYNWALSAQTWSPQIQVSIPLVGSVGWEWWVRQCWRNWALSASQSP